MPYSAWRRHAATTDRAGRRRLPGRAVSQAAAAIATRSTATMIHGAAAASNQR